MSTSAAAISSLFCFIHQFQPPSPSLDQQFSGNSSANESGKLIYPLLSLHSCSAFNPYTLQPSQPCSRLELNGVTLNTLELLERINFLKTSHFHQSLAFVLHVESLTTCRTTAFLDSGSAFGLLHSLLTSAVTSNVASFILTLIATSNSNSTTAVASKVVVT